MIAINNNRDQELLALCLKEVAYPHRWGRHGEATVAREQKLLTKLYAKAKPLNDHVQKIMEQIINLEICNWRLEDSILVLCRAIGNKKPAARGIGHLASITRERWRQLWAYWLACRNWVSRPHFTGYPAMLACCDPQGTIQRHVGEMLGRKTDLKLLYVERFAHCLEYWLGICPLTDDSPAKLAHKASVKALEEKILNLNPQDDILPLMVAEGDGRLQACNHKSFRRYTIILSGIGAGNARAVMPVRGTDGLERAALLDEYLLPIKAWKEGENTNKAEKKSGISAKIKKLLGERDEQKIFLVAFLYSILRSQQLSARQRAEKRLTKTD